eukprot:13263224-Alexandrium_andersonii.AAC.1
MTIQASQHFKLTAVWGSSPYARRTGCGPPWNPLLSAGGVVYCTPDPSKWLLHRAPEAPFVGDPGGA